MGEGAVHSQHIIGVDACIADLGLDDKARPSLQGHIARHTQLAHEGFAIWHHRSTILYYQGIAATASHEHSTIVYGDRACGDGIKSR